MYLNTYGKGPMERDHRCARASTLDKVRVLENKRGWVPSVGKGIGHRKGKDTSRDVRWGEDSIGGQRE